MRKIAALTFYTLLTLRAELPTVTDSLAAAPAEARNKGNALESLLTQKLGAILPASPETARLIQKVIAASQLKESELPQKTLAALSGLPIKKGKLEGTIQIALDDEYEHRAAPGFPSSVMESLKTALGPEGKTAAVELNKSNWTIKEGTFATETGKKPSNSSSLILLSDYQPDTDSFLCRKTKQGYCTYGRLAASDLAFCATAFAIPSVTWQDNAATTNATLPPDFNYDKTLSLPGQFVFLAVPFIKQLPKGICTAAAMLNVLAYIDPDFNLDQEEIFKLFNNQSSGAYSSQMLGGLENLGFECEYIRNGSLDSKTLVAKIQASLDAGRPVIITQPRHALTVIGYDNSKKILIGWDQARTYRAINLPFNGGFQIPYASAEKQIQDVFLVRAVSEKPSREEEEKILKLLPSATDLQRHSFVNSNERQEKDSRFALHALPQTIKALARRARIILIPNGQSGIIQVIPKLEGHYPCTYLPENKQENRSIHTLTREILDAKGTFFSIKTP